MRMSHLEQSAQDVWEWALHKELVAVQHQLHLAIVACGLPDEHLDLIRQLHLCRKHVSFAATRDLQPALDFQTSASQGSLADTALFRRKFLPPSRALAMIGQSEAQLSFAQHQRHTDPAKASAMAVKSPALACTLVKDERALPPPWRAC